MTTARSTAGLTRTQTADDIRTDLATAELERLAAEDTGRPWAMMLGYMLPHFPYEVSEEFAAMYPPDSVGLPRPPPGGRTYGECLPDFLAGHRRWWTVAAGEHGVTTDHIRTARRCYYGMVSCMDAYIGRVLETVARCGFAANTWIVFLADHGESLGEHGLWSKGTFYEESVRIPLVIVPPGEYRHGGARCGQPVSQVDWLPTVLDLVGVEGWGEPLPGRSLLPLVDEPNARWPDHPVIADYGFAGFTEPVRMVRRGAWSAWFGLTLPPVLFNLEADPRQWTDLAGQEAYRERLNELEGIARADGWDPDRLRVEIIRAQRRMRFIRDAAGGGDRFAKFVEGAPMTDPGLLAQFGRT